MPIYEFEDPETGEEREEFFGMARAPQIGSTITRDGRKWRRLPPTLGAVRAKDPRHTAVSQPLNWGRDKLWADDGAKVDRGTGKRFNWSDKGFSDRYDATGRPQFDNMREIREAESRALHAGEGEAGFKGYDK